MFIQTETTPNPATLKFLRGRAVLKRALVLIDSRHGPKDVDREMMKLLDEAAVGYRLVLTKADTDGDSKLLWGDVQRPEWKRELDTAADTIDRIHLGAAARDVVAITRQGGVRLYRLAR